MAYTSAFDEGPPVEESGLLSARKPSPVPRISPMSTAGVAMFLNHRSLENATGSLSARGPVRPATGGVSAAERQLAEAEASFFTSEAEKEEVNRARHSYPARKTKESQRYDQLTGEPEEYIPRRIMGFGLGFEKVFATTSIKLPVSAYTIFVELHVSHNDEVYSRCFNGLHTVFDLKKWIYEKLFIPIPSYDLSYAEPGKAALTDQLRLLTTQDSLDTRTMATTRAVQRMYKGIPGVHSIGDIGVTRLYVRLKCRTCGDIMNSLQVCRRFKTFSDIEALPEPDWHMPSQMRKDGKSKDDKGGNRVTVGGKDESRRMTLAQMSSSAPAGPSIGVPGRDPNIEDRWHTPDAKKHCLLHGTGFELYEAAKNRGEHAIAKIYISCGKEPSRKLKVAESFNQSLNAAAKKVQY